MHDSTSLADLVTPTQGPLSQVRPKTVRKKKRGTLKFSDPKTLKRAREAKALRDAARTVHVDVVGPSRLSRESKAYESVCSWDHSGSIGCTIGGSPEGGGTQYIAVSGEESGATGDIGGSRPHSAATPDTDGSGHERGSDTRHECVGLEVSVLQVMQGLSLLEETENEVSFRVSRGTLLCVLSQCSMNRSNYNECRV